MAIMICPHCSEVYDANDFDEDWATIGCPACIDEVTGGI